MLDLDAAQEALDAVARAHFAPDFVWEDRRPIVGLSGDLDLMLASARERLASGARHERRTIVGTAGDRVAIARVLWAGGPPDGRFEVEFLAVHEVDEAGLCTALLFFDPDDAARRAARGVGALGGDRSRRGAVGGDPRRAHRGVERPRPRAASRPASQMTSSSRITGARALGRIEGADAYLEANAVLWDLAPEQRIEFGWSWPALDRHGAISTLRREGTLADGGAFESEYLWLA